MILTSTGELEGPTRLHHLIIPSLCRDFPDLNRVVYEGAEENNHLLRVRD